MTWKKRKGSATAWEASRFTRDAVEYKRNRKALVSLLSGGRNTETSGKEGCGDHHAKIRYDEEFGIQTPGAGFER